MFEKGITAESAKKLTFSDPGEVLGAVGPDAVQREVIKTATKKATRVSSSDFFYHENECSFTNQSTTAKKAADTKT